MIVTRIAQSQYIRALDGMGSFMYGGRWTSKGTHAIYTAENASLAYLEYLAHQFERKTWPKDLAISKLSIDDTDVFTVDTDSLPADWKSVRYIARTQIVGDKYFGEEKLAIRLPSVIVEDECNVIINPKHKNFSSSVQLQKVEPLDLDKRFKQS